MAAAVSLEFLQSMIQRLTEKVDKLTTAVDLDRRNTRSMYDNMSIEMGYKIGALDAKLEIGFEIVNNRIDQLEEKLDKQTEMLEALLKK